jgi:hypothetical protein
MLSKENKSKDNGIGVLVTPVLGLEWKFEIISQ